MTRLTKDKLMAERDSPGTDRSDFWVWMHFPLAGRSGMGCHDGRATVPISAGRNLRYPGDFRLFSGDRPSPGQVIGIIIRDANPTQVQVGVGHRFYVPTANDLRIVQSLFPDDDSGNPLWIQVEAELILTGMGKSELQKHNAATLIRLLQRERNKPSRRPDLSERRDALLPPAVIGEAGMAEETHGNAQEATGASGGAGIRGPESADDGKPPKRKRSSEKGEGRAKLIAALTKYHKYADGSVLNLEPIGNNELAELAGVDKATASAFFKQQFKGHAKYKGVCSDSGRLAAALKLLNGEFAPHLLYGNTPSDDTDEGENDFNEDEFEHNSRD